jgi:hypothetical protein
MSAVQLSILQAIEQRDKGIERAVSHAGKKSPGWIDDAYDMFKDWLTGWPVGFRFTIESFRQIASIRGLPDPPHNRAFGGLAVRARNNKLIKAAGTVQVENVKAHRCYCTQWEKI